MHKPALVSLLLLGMIGCSDTGTGASSGRGELSAERAVSLFETVCLDTFPSFTGALKKLNKLGAAPTRVKGKTLYTFASLPASFSLDRSGATSSCTLNYSGADGGGIGAALQRVGTPLTPGVFGFKGNANHQIKTLSSRGSNDPSRSQVTVTIGSPK